MVTKKLWSLLFVLLISLPSWAADITGKVFLLWGRFAQGKAALVDTTRHHVLTAAHPSPLAGGAFFGCRHFSQTNIILRSEGKTPIDWQL